MFGDRLSVSSHKDEFFREMKKEALIKFKENFNLNAETMFSFTSLGIENENCYIRVEDSAYLHNYISNLLESDEINLPLKYLFNELLGYLLKIYRIIAVEGSHLLLLAHNQTTATYLIKLACQVSQNYCYSLNQEPISVEKHIEPALFFKENVCFNETIEGMNEETVHQVACLLNGNVYDFQVKPEIKDKIKVNLNKKEKVETGKKETRFAGKNKTELFRNEQKEDDIEVLMAEQFMTYTHFMLQASPVDSGLRTFLKNQPDIVGKLHFSWVDIPQLSLVKVAKQILSFDQESI